MDTDKAEICLQHIVIELCNVYAINRTQASTRGALFPLVAQTRSPDIPPKSTKLTKYHHSETLLHKIPPTIIFGLVPVRQRLKNLCGEMPQWYPSLEPSCRAPAIGSAYGCFCLFPRKLRWDNCCTFSRNLLGDLAALGEKPLPGESSA